MYKIYLVLFLSLILGVTGCTSTVPYSIPSNLSKDKLATLYIYRTNVLFHSLKLEKPFFYLDGKSIGKLGTGQSITINIPAGEHNISVKAPLLFMPSYEKDRISFKAKANNDYYIRYSEEMDNIIIGATPNTTDKSSLQIVDKKYFLEKK